MKTNAVIDVFSNIFNDAKIPYDYLAEESVIKTGFQVDCKLKQANVQIEVKDAGVNFYIISPMPANKEFLKEIREYLSLVNLELQIGSFKINPEDGMIFFKYELITYWLESLPKEAAIEIIKTAVLAFQQFGDGIAEIAQGLSDAETELVKAKTK